MQKIAKNMQKSEIQELKTCKNIKYKKRENATNVN